VEHNVFLTNCDEFVLNQCPIELDTKAEVVPIVDRPGCLAVNIVNGTTTDGDGMDFQFKMIKVLGHHRKHYAACSRKLANPSHQVKQSIVLPKQRK